jgi:hypothetical protein
LCVQKIDGAEWKMFPAHGVAAPDCRETEFTRDNHLGNGLGGQPNVYNWTVPNIDAKSCVLRIRCFAVSLVIHDVSSASDKDKSSYSEICE